MAKSKAKRRVVRGPQGVLPLGKASGDLPELAKGRTPRMRYVERPSKRDGNPFFALRVPSNVLSAFKAKAKRKNLAGTVVVREFMAKFAGVKLPAVADE